MTLRNSDLTFRTPQGRTDSAAERRMRDFSAWALEYRQRERNLRRRNAARGTAICFVAALPSAWLIWNYVVMPLARMAGLLNFFPR